MQDIPLLAADSAKRELIIQGYIKSFPFFGHLFSTINSIFLD
jgi:hypothetical protein